MKTSIFKKMAFAFAAFAAFAGSASAYTEGDIAETTGTGTKNDPVQVNTFTELKAALESTEINYVELGDVSGAAGYIQLGEEGEPGFTQAIQIKGEKHLTLSGTAEFIPDPNYKAVQSFVFFDDYSASLVIDGDGTLKFSAVTSSAVAETNVGVANFMFWLFNYGRLTIDSGNLISAVHGFTVAHTAVIYSSSNSADVTINGGYLKAESNDGEESYAVEIVRGSFKMYGGTIEKTGKKLTAGDASLYFRTNGAGIYGGTLKSDGKVKAIKLPEAYTTLNLDNFVHGKAVNANNDEVSLEQLSISETVTIVAYGIKTAQDLRDFAAKVNSGEEPSAWAVLMADIDLNPGKTVLNGDGSLYNNGEGLETWTPIGTESNRYLGTFDGNGHTIRGLYFNDENTYYVGLFGYIDESAKVQNVGVVDSYIKGYFYVGGIVGNNLGQVINVFNSASVTGYAYVGGVIGEDYGSVRNSYNVGQVSLWGNGAYLGGVVGLVEGGTIENVYSIGSVGVNGVYFGGVAGMFTWGTFSNRCYYSTTACPSCRGAANGADDAANNVVGKTSAELAALNVATAFTFAEGEENPWTEGTTVSGDGFVTYKFPYLTKFGEKSQPELSPAVEFAAGNASATVYGATTGAVNIPADIEVSGSITFNRAFPNLDAEDTYSTIMLPFESASKPTGVTFYTIGSISEVDGKWKVTAVVENGNIAANTPYLVKVASGTKSITFNGGTFKKTEGEHSVTNGNWKFVGSYEYKAWEEGNAGLGKTYGFAGSNGNDPSIVGKFAKVGAGAYIYPMRAYLEYNASAAGRPAANGAKPAVASLPDEIEVVIVDKDEATGEETTKVIGSLNTRTDEIKFANDRWFDLNGRYLGNKKPTQKGAYYNNGKKVIVK